MMVDKVQTKETEPQQNSSSQKVMGITKCLQEIQRKKSDPKFQKISGLQEFLNWKIQQNDEQSYTELFTWLKDEFTKVVDFMQYKIATMELDKK